MQGRYHQVTGEGSTHDDTGRFLISNFADDQHLRVLSQQMPRGYRKAQTAGLVDLGLHDTGTICSTGSSTVMMCRLPSAAKACRQA